MFFSLGNVPEWISVCDGVLRWDFCFDGVRLFRCVSHCRSGWTGSHSICDRVVVGVIFRRPLADDSLLSPRLVDNSLLKSGLRYFFNFLGRSIWGWVLFHFVVRAVENVVFLFFSIGNCHARTRKSAMMKTVQRFLNHLCGQNCISEPFFVAAGRTFFNVRNRR